MKIRDLNPKERPREKLLANGVSYLSDPELLAVILRTGVKGKNAVDFSRDLLSNHGLAKLSTMSISQLRRTAGLGLAKASAISASFELSKRVIKNTSKTTIKSYKDLAPRLISEMSTLKKENFKGIYLDSRMKIIVENTLFIGCLDRSIVHPREIFQPAIAESAAAIIIVHNHPSGDPTPSEEDIVMTKQLKFAATLMDIDILDHIIVGSDKCYSMKEKGDI